ncbi:response regulator transcription factor [Tissierella carlieri]|uniref:response regulator transcription factor n=1 Tax=Tissierella carlieri TaxID=689904 RepID=UPI001C103EE9|nr:response regulator transcription factor [Tissierella carlieri]MBU5310452.1 response regulator transcription factor [Tissierella carlieri]
MQKILIVEDDLDIQELLENHLCESGYEVCSAKDGIEAISLFEKNKYDLVLLDIMLPKIDGYGVCELIRQQSQIPIIMLTALDSEADQIKGFDLQIDDYVTKTFSMPILKRKINALLRRTSSYKIVEQYLHYNNILLDLEGYKAYVEKKDIDLTAKEFEILRELLLNQGRVFTRKNLLNILWNYDFWGDERIVDTHIKNIRKKLGTDIIETIRGVGYRVAKENKK